MLRIICLVGILYLVFLLALRSKAFERFYIYFPETSLDATPADYGLQFEDLTIETQDGLRLHGWWIEKQKDLPVILILHGNAGNISHRLDRVHSFWTLPVNWCLVDYRGYGKSEGKPDARGLERDANAIYSYVTKTRKIPSSKIILWGESLGAALAIKLGSRHAIGGLITENAFTSIRDMAAKVLPIAPRFLVPNIFDSIGSIAEVIGPKLIVHGRDDEMIPFEMAGQLFSKATEPKKLLVVDGASHNDLYIVARDEYTEAIQAFILPNKGSVK